MELSKPVEMIRVETTQMYDRDAVLGRDAESVFPSLGKANPTSTTNSRFISEAELEAIKKKRGARVEDGSIAADRPLSIILQENKDKKEEEFQKIWKDMKTGKNRPLDEDELEFLDGVVERERTFEEKRKEEEAAELEAFQLMREQIVVKAAVPDAAQRPKPIKADVPLKAKAASAVKVVVAKKSGRPGEEPAKKKAKTDGGVEKVKESGNGDAGHRENEEGKKAEVGGTADVLGSLLAGYGSDDDAD